MLSEFLYKYNDNYKYYGIVVCKHIGILIKWSSSTNGEKKYYPMFKFKKS